MRGLMGKNKWPASVAQRADARLCVQEAWVRTPTGAVLKNNRILPVDGSGDADTGSNPGRARWVGRARVRVPDPAFGETTRQACRLRSDRSKLTCVLGLYTLAA